MGMVQLLWETVWQFLKILKIELYNPEIPLISGNKWNLLPGTQIGIFTW